jgi:ABC-type multidrug transport system fused ATPase/permease subunit
VVNGRLLRLVGAWRREVVLAVLLGLAITSTYVGQGLLVAYALARIFQGQPVSDIVSLLVAALVLIGVRAALIRARELAGVAAATAAKHELRQRLYRHLLQLGPGHLLRTRTGAVLTTLVDGVEALDRYVATFVPQLTITLVGAVAIVAVITTIDPVVGGVVLAGGVAVAFAPRLARRLLKRHSRNYWRQWRLLGSEYLDSIQGMSTLKALGASEAQGNSLYERSWGFYRASIGVTAVSNLSVGAVGLAESAGLALSLGVGALRFTAGAISITELLVLLLLTREAFRPLRDLQTAFHATYTAEAAAGGIFELLEATPDVTDTPTERAIEPVADGPPSVAFEGVSFAYRPGARPALTGFSLAVAPGETVAIVGPSGSGKTTVMSLLLRFFDPDEGRVVIDGTDVRDIELQRLREMLAIVSQDVYLFHGPVWDNVAFGRPGATESDVRRAIAAANAAEFIDALPTGADSVIGDRGLTLAGGQRQRLAIARALLKDAPILLLDEATSSVDVAGERVIQQALERLRAGRTTLVIAHRLSTVRNADRIVVLRGGRVVERGDHHSMLAADGTYARLVASQES